MSFSCTDKETLVSYIYGECDAATRGAVDAHLAGCPACADEVAGFGDGERNALAVGGARACGRLPAGARRGGARDRRTGHGAAAGALVAVRAAGARARGGGHPARGRRRGAGQPRGALRQGRFRRPDRMAEGRPRPSSRWRRRRGGAGARAAAGRGGLRAAREPGRPMPRRGAPSWWRSSGRCATRSASRWRRRGRRPPARCQVGASGTFDRDRFMQQVYTLLDESERRQQVDVAYRMSVLAATSRPGARSTRGGSAWTPSPGARRNARGTPTCSTSRPGQEVAPSAGTRRQAPGSKGAGVQ